MKRVVLLAFLVACGDNSAAPDAYSCAATDYITVHCDVACGDAPRAFEYCTDQIGACYPGFISGQEDRARLEANCGMPATCSAPEVDCGD